MSPIVPSPLRIILEEQDLVDEEVEDEINNSQEVIVMEDGEIVMPGTGQVRDPHMYFDDDDSFFSKVSDHTPINTPDSDPDYIPSSQSVVINDDNNNEENEENNDPMNISQVSELSDELPSTQGTPYKNSTVRLDGHFKNYKKK